MIYKVVLIKGMDWCPGLHKLVVYLIKIRDLSSTPSYDSGRMTENILLDGLWCFEYESSSGSWVWSG